VFITLFIVPAGDGQMIKSKWGKSIDNRLGWVVMEIPVVIAIITLWLLSERRFETVPIIFICIFNLHYIQRTFIFPLLIRGKERMPVIIMIFGMVFNTANAFMQGLWIFYYAPEGLYSVDWLKTPQFIIGTIIFLSGFVINLNSDHIIRNLRKPGDTTYCIPKGGMFKYVTSANYFGELTEWVGWAILTFSFPGLVFAIWTFGNLGPRAHSLRKWYSEKFGAEFDKLNRKRIIPFIW
jgi:3-oxo-5-alpha-steroid 4-dehydrogenase 1